jgi:cell division septal protein FtsQ
MDMVLRTAKSGESAALAADSGGYMRRQSGRAVRKSKKQSRWWAFALRVTVYGLGLLIAAAIGLSVYQYLFYSHSFDLQHLVFSGNRFSNLENLRSTLELGFSKNLLSVNLTQLRKVIEADPWVLHTRIRRVLPDTLKIDIEERKPVALAAIRDTIYITDSEGTLLDRYSAKYGKLDLPLLKGLEGDVGKPAGDADRRRMAIFLKAMQELDSENDQYTRQISEADAADDQNLVVVPMDDTVRIQLGHQDFLKRFRTHMERLNYYREMKDRYGDIESIDLRYDKQIIYQPVTGSQVAPEENLNPQKQQ